ncbi:MAG: di-trans,poly-cis-decaprenylcistransferase [Alteromonadaceae bacterium]|nr:MAG: di-trans,poly-cis-decaprenylcistransferase [Alteromonadaceae bacterium]
MTRLADPAPQAKKPYTNLATSPHVGIIMDGNGRWASQKHMDRSDGHKAGAKICMDIIHRAIDHNVRVLSLFAFSTENWQRPDKEVSSIMKILNSYLESEILAFLKRGVRFKAIGERSKLSFKTRLLISKAESLSKNNTGMTLVLAVNYGGQDDIVRSIKRLADDGYDFSKINADDLQQNLDTGDLPPVDLMIRTSGEERLSNFLLWQAAYAEFYFTKTPWPDFSADAFSQALNNFGERNRRFGKAESSPMNSTSSPNAQ